MNVTADPPLNETPEEREIRYYEESIGGCDALEAAFEALSNDDLQRAYSARHPHHVFWREAVQDVWNRRKLTFPNIVEDLEGRGYASCGFCGCVLYTSFEGLLAHFRPDGTCVNGFTKDYVCVPCNRPFETRAKAHKHFMTQDRLDHPHKKKKLYCEPCKHQCHTDKGYAKHCETKHHHKVTHPDEFDCKECGLHFKFKSELDRHLTTKAHQPEPESLHCHVCGVDFRCKADKDRHMAGKQHLYKADPTLRPTLTCELCGITRPSHGQYLEHLKTAKHQKKAAACLEDPSSPDDATA